MTKSNLLALGFFSNVQYKIPIAAILAFFNYSLCGDFKTVQIIGVLVAIDFITGVIKGYKKRNFSSVRLGKTGVKIVLYFLLLVMGHQIEQLYFYPEWTDELVESYIGAVEVYSIMENAALLGFTPALKLAKRLNAKLEQDKDCGDNS